MSKYQGNNESQNVITYQSYWESLSAAAHDVREEISIVEDQFHHQSCEPRALLIHHLHQEYQQLIC